MDVRPALKQQYHAGLAMLAQCAERCPAELWRTGEEFRPFWRVVFHAAYFTHLYLGQNEGAFQKWEGQKEGVHTDLWLSDKEVALLASQKDPEIYDTQEMLAYIHWIDAQVDNRVDHLNLESEETGFSWYKNMTKLSHQLLNLRHLQGHIGQLSERLMAQGIDTDWVSKSAGWEQKP
jgi:hypothetical protein